MTRKSKTNQIDELLYKPLILHNQNGEDSFIIIFGSDSQTSKALSPKGKEITQTTDYIHIFNVTDSVESGVPVIESCVVADINKFKKNISILDMTEHYQELMESAAVIGEVMTEMVNKMNTMSKVTMAIKKIAEKAKESDSGGLIIDSETSNIARIFFSSVTGKTAELQKEDIQRLGSIIMDVVSKNIHLDLSDKERINKLKAEVEYKLIDALPPNLKADDINISMDSILQEIKKLQNFIDGDDSESDE